MVNSHLGVILLGLARQQTVRPQTKFLIRIETYQLKEFHTAR
jgi:hypothetical protein